MDHGENRVLVVIPALNEGQNIEQTVRGIRALNQPWDILVVDDGSSDDTAVLARQANAHALSLPFRVGIGAAVSLGLMYACQRGYKAVIRVDADGQHPAEFMELVLSPVLTGEADLCVGSRFLNVSWAYRSSPLRRAGILFFSTLISVLIRDKVTDPTSGFCAFSPGAIRLFAQHYPSDYPEPEAITIAKRAGLNFMEVPVRMNSRVHGLSSIRYFKTLYYMIKVTLAIVLNYLKPIKK